MVAGPSIAALCPPRVGLPCAILPRPRERQAAGWLLYCPLRGVPHARRGLWVSQPCPTNQAFCSQHAAGERSAAPPSPPFCTSAPTAVRQCPLGSVLAGEQPDSSRSAAVSRSERSAQATRPPLAALATDLIASSISRPSASKLSMMDIVDREADAERPRGG